MENKQFEKYQNKLNKYQEKIDAVHGKGNWKLLTYTKATEPCKVMHKCGHIKDVAQARTMLLERLGKCECDNLKQGRPRLTFEEKAQRIDELTNGEYELVYLESSLLYAVKHKKCGRVFETNTQKFESMGSRCPSCSKAWENQNRKNK